MQLADFVMPFFLFMVRAVIASLRGRLRNGDARQVGTSMSMTFRRHSSGLQSKVVIRTIKLFVIGVATQACTHIADPAKSFEIPDHQRGVV